MDRRIWLAALLILTGACAGDPGAERTGSATLDEATTRTLEAELVEADRAFARDVRNEGLGAWIDAFAPGGRMISGGESYIGSEAIRRQMLPAFADSTFSLTWDPIYAEIGPSGDLGYTVGHFEASSGSGDDAVEQEGTYLTVWRRQPDGSWKVKADIGNPKPGGGD